jgi:sugar O-acyltransferase (sialic acid O-acetyltransferase NeuD family)
MKNSFLIWGAKGHAKVLGEIIHLNNKNITIFIDNDKISKSPISGVPVLHGKNQYYAWLKRTKQTNSSFDMSAIAAIGGSRGKDRLEYLILFRSDGFNVPSLIHPSAYISSTKMIGDNCQICALSFVGVDVSLGDACIINTKASVDHESNLGNGVHIAPGATLCGCVEIEDNAFIGAGAIVLPNIKIGSNSIIGAGSLVTRDVPSNVLVYGNPARIIRKI